MRGEKSLVVAKIIDIDGKSVYNIIPTIWVRLLVITLSLVLMVVAVMGLFIVSNRIEIEQLLNRQGQPCDIGR